MTTVKIHPDLQRERDGSKLNVLALTHALDGSAKATERRRFMQNLVANDKSGVFENNEDGIFMHRKDRHVRALAKFVRCVELARQMNFGQATDGELTIDPDFLMLLEAVADDFPTLLHWVMFVPNIRSLADDEQRSKWLPLCRDWRMIGCYAQTELGHGSNVRALETTATFDKHAMEGGAWKIHSPTLTAAKFWPGTLGRTANHAMVIARLIDGQGIDRGMHNFLVPLRDMQTHKLLPGVTTGDIGPKIGYNNMDNGFASFDNVIIPRRNMAMRFAMVDSNGNYTKKPMSPAASKISYITMMQVRAVIIKDTGRLLAMASTISIRYSSLRRQGYDATNKQEIPILNYRQQQHRLLPLLAASYVIYFSGIQTQTHLTNLEHQLIHNPSTTKVTKTQVSDLHASTSALKSFASTLSTDGIEDCRKACGGHGFLASSGLPELLTYSLQHPTVEGDNHMLPQQVARVLLKLVNAVAKNDQSLIQEWKQCDASYLLQPVTSILTLRAEQPLPNESRNNWTKSSILQAHEYRSAALLCELSKQIHNDLTQNKVSMSTAWNNALVQMARVNKAHAICLLLHKFEACMSEQKRHGNLGALEIKAMDDLFKLFGLFWLEKDMGDFVLHNIISTNQTQSIRSLVLKMLDIVRPDAVALVDAWDFPDSRLKSTLGRYDGQVYTAILEAAKKDPLNATEPGPGYHQHLKRLIVDGVGVYSETASRL